MLAGRLLLTPLDTFLVGTCEGSVVEMPRALDVAIVGA